MFYKQRVKKFGTYLVFHCLRPFRETSSDSASGPVGWALAHLEFGSSVNPITTRGTDYAHQITACPPGFENLTASLMRSLQNAG